MMFAVQYATKGNTGLMIFSAETLEAAQIYMREMVTLHGHTHVYNLNELTEGTIAELFRLYPRIANVTVRGSVTSKGQVPKK